MAATKHARRRNRNIAPPVLSRPLVIGAGKGDAVAIPAIVIFVDREDWDPCAKALGGTSNSLFTAFAAKLAERVGCRRGDDGRIRVGITVNDRCEGDMRANAFSPGIIDVDPTGLTTDVSGVRTSIKNALAALPDHVAEAAQLQPLIPLTPEWLARRMTGTLLATPAVGCSYLGDIDPMIGRPDGSDADSFFARGVAQRVTRQIVEQMRGMTAVSGGRVGDKVFYRRRRIRTRPKFPV
ncbi:hypothetical protein [Mycobacterium ostraviense]|uniref:hypothetical protein n=1 Tax=Mycobacterium ostraviense TaxID=2738409 RepID=UPI0015D4E950|nr:hypothetical protein [Mycobacterium ostraviense]UGT89727.1 hypothetical protein LTS72_14895 [Mycobacterium ostraviense]